MMWRRWAWAAAMMLAASTMASYAAAQDAPINWVARFSSFKGKGTCNYGDPGCNSCVKEVAEQFANLTQRGNHTVRIKEWEWKRLTDYGPSNRKPNEVLTPQPGQGHFQSFVRAQTDVHGYPDFFASHDHSPPIDSAGAKGMVFGIQGGADASGRATDGSLKYIFNGAGKHPGGMQAIGHYLLYVTESKGEGGAMAKLEIVDLSSPTSARTVLDLPGMSRVANVAVQNVKGGGYLILVSNSSYHNDFRLFYTTSLSQPRLEVVYAGSLQADQDSGIYEDGEERVGFENLSIVTECGTEKTFVVAATAPAFGADDNLSELYLDGSSVWHLYELVPGGKVPLRFVARNTRDLFAPECDPRAAGTAFAGRNGELGLYCHQKAQDAWLRRKGWACGAAVVFGLFGGIAESLCSDVLVADKKIRFTEYWPHLTASGQPVIQTFEVKIAVNNAAVLDAKTGMICESDGARTVNCTWRVDAGQELVLIPIGPVATVHWGTECAERNTASTTGRAAECVRTVNGPLDIGLFGDVILL